jgi:hypothetical protein
MYRSQVPQCLTPVKEQEINLRIFIYITNLRLAKKVFPSNFAVFDQVWSQVYLRPDLKKRSK